MLLGGGRGGSRGDGAALRPQWPPSGPHTGGNTNNFIADMRDLGADSPELEADLRKISDELLEAMEASKESFMPMPPLAMGDN